MADDIKNPLELSDDEILNAPEPEVPEEEPEAEQEDTADTTDSEDSEEDNDAAEDDSDEEEDEDDEEVEDEETEEDAEDEEVEEKEDSTDSETSDADEKEPEPETTTPKSEDKSEKSTEVVDNTVNYEAEYNKLLTPFRANGRDVQITSVDQARQLMQMGAGYNHKMAGLKPSLKLLKMLENNSLLDEEKIGYLIDLDKKDPEAIKKLIKDSGIDPLEVDVSADTEYKPNTYTVDDRQVELDGVLAEIEHTDSYANTIDIISNKWDDSSKKALYENPSDIKFINDQVASGIFKQIDDMVQNQRMLGELKGVSDIDAYRAVGSYMQENSMFTGQTPNEQTKVPANVETESKNTSQSPKLKNRKKAASSTKSAPSKTKKNDYNPLSMSDDEFDKVTTPLI